MAHRFPALSFSRKGVDWSADVGLDGGQDPWSMYVSSNGCGLTRPDVSILPEGWPDSPLTHH